jgi:hypothetical protein
MKTIAIHQPNYLPWAGQLDLGLEGSPFLTAQILFQVQPKVERMTISFRADELRGTML